MRVDYAEIRQVGGVESRIQECGVVEGVEEIKGILDSEILANLGDFSKA